MKVYQVQPVTPGAPARDLKEALELADKGGALDGVGGKRDEAWLRAYLADPKSQIPDAKMPNLKLAPADLDALVAYMLSLK